MIRALDKYKDYPAVSFPQYQIFTPNRYQIKPEFVCCLIKNSGEIKLNGGGDLTLATLKGELIDPKKGTYSKYSIFQYESTFRTKDIIKNDRARFARAWYRQFNTYKTRGGPSQIEAYDAWFDEIKIGMKTLF